LKENQAAFLPKILINSVPKSGTNLLLQIIEGIPGLTRIPEKDFLQLQPGEYATGHRFYTEELSRKLKGCSIKQVFIYRDIRDVTVSLRHFINRLLPTHPLFPVFQHRLVTKDEQLAALIEGVDLIGDELNNSWGMSRYPGVFEELRDIYRWKEDVSVCSMRYEDLMDTDQTRGEVIGRIIDFLWEDIQEYDKEQLVYLMTQNINPEKSWTFRKGSTGGWKEEFNEEHKRALKKTAGELLIQLGYEKDDRW
jgi:hypothetical protein